MKSRTLLALVAGAVIAILPCHLLAADSEGTVVKLSDLPEAARTTIQSHAGRGKVGEIIKTIESGEARYDVELTNQRRTRSMVLNDKGEVLEMQVFLGETPHAIQQAIHKHVGDGKIDEITKNTEDGEISYDVEMTKDGKARTFTLDEAGEVTDMQVFLDELPEPVRAAIQKETGSGKCGEINKTNEDGDFLYETEITQGSKTRSVSFDSKGSLVYQEEPVALSDLPESVRKSVEEQVAGGKLVSIDKVLSDGETSYAVDLLKADKHVCASLSTDGKPLGSDAD